MANATIASNKTGSSARSFLGKIDLVPAVMVLLVISILAPVAVLVYGSFTNAPIGTSFSGLTLDNFITITTNADYLRALANTVFVGVLATMLAALLGIPLAWIVVRSDVPWANLLRIGIMIPFFLSPFVGALAWTLLLQRDVGPINLAF
ncbi:MAG TPA: hypothetical protein VL147_08950, partial [Devosia sp.]|nr:hypothetical protein [Devosia sp.]